MIIILTQILIQGIRHIYNTKIHSLGTILNFIKYSLTKLLVFFKYYFQLNHDKLNFNGDKNKF